ncbi:uncharacterized protein LOC119387364 [Rhipicephalus sanguineus]|uniref:uncharacterized protein LOC119387364 n=1 Tax=Rhipicephalus sanguineus TaxID=34632 RepID=UPI0018953052|nr:uncharacterized protein LOC119387364 [Rhipicephalus sanguineus]
MKVLKTYGRKFKTSFLEVSNTKRDWSPEVVVLQTPPRNRSEILFESLCNPSAQVKRAPRGKVKYGNVTNLFNVSSVRPDYARRKKSGSTCGLSENRSCRKRPQQNGNALRKPLAAQQNGVAQSLADRRARPRRQKVTRPPTKLSLRSKKLQVQPLPSTSTRDGDSSRSKSAMMSPSSACSTSSCEIPRHLLKDDESFSLSLGSPVNPTSSTPKNDVKCGNRVDEDSIGLSVLSDMNSIDLSSLRFPKAGSSISYGAHRKPRYEQTYTADGSVPSFLVPEESSKWVTIRKKRNRANWRCDDKENRKKARPSFESGEASNSPVREKWSPVMVSTPVSDAQVNKVETRKAWLLSSAMETPHVAPATSCKNSVLAKDSATLKKQVQRTGTHKGNGGLRRKLSSAVLFQVPSPENHSGLSRKSFPEGNVTATSQSLDSSKQMSTLTNSCRSESACSITPLQCSNSSAELFVSQQTNVQMKDLSVDVADLQQRDLSKPDATFSVHSARLDTSGLQGSAHMYNTEESKSHILIESKASHQLLGNYSKLFTKKLRVELDDIMKKSDGDEERLQHSSLLVAQSYSEQTFLSEKGTLHDAFKLKEPRVVLTDHQEAKLNKNAQHYSPRMPSLVDKDNAKQSVSFREATTWKDFPMKGVHIVLEDVRRKIQNKNEAHLNNGEMPGISSTVEPQSTNSSNDIVQLCSLKNHAVWEKLHLKGVRVILTDLKDQSAITQNKNEAHVNNTYSCKEPLMRDPLCVPFAHEKRLYKRQSPSSSSELQCSPLLDVGTVRRSSNAPLQHCPRGSSEANQANVPVAKLGQAINSVSCQMEQKLLQTNDRESTIHAGIRKGLEGHDKGVEIEPLSIPSIALTCRTENTASCTTDGVETQIMPSPYNSSKYKSDSEKVLKPYSLKLKEAKVVLKRCNTQCQPMQPPPAPPASKKKSAKSKNCLNTGRSDCVQKQRITGPSCNSSQNQSKKENWAACTRRQPRLTMARKSEIPPRVPLDANQMLLEMCNQDEPLTFKQALGMRAFKECVKIGEGTYGEVFRIGHGSKSSAIKIVPIEGSFPMNGENQKTAAQILPEAIICQELSALSRTDQAASCPNFIEVKRLYYIQGRYPPALLKQWDVYDSERRSENDRPDCFKADQKYLMFQFSDGGTSLEDYEINSATEAKSIFLQVACALAVAETALKFEHRDLHWGNILVAPTQKRHIHCHLPQGHFTLKTNGVFASVIDYTLSRLCKGRAVVFTDVSEEDELFRGVGDYQFDIYRRMKEENKNDWKSFNPYTNALWLHYLSCKLLEKGCSSARSRQQSSAIAELREWSDTLILQCPSSMDVFLRCIGTQSTQKRAGA